jgi:hypothetical protein
MGKENEAMPKARFATIPTLIATIVVHHLNPPPKPATFRIWLERAGVPKIKANPTAIRGGGPAYYSVPHVEKLLRRGV